MSEIFSEQLTAAATLALAVLALAAAVLAGLAYLKQSKEVSILLEQNKRDTDERRRAQAARIFLVIPGRGKASSERPYVHNASEFPVYSVEMLFFEHRDAQTGDVIHLGTIMPGETAHTGDLISREQANSFVRLSFMDSAGIQWWRSPDGRLIELH